MRANGLYGHVRRNDLRSALLFGGFVVAFHVMALLALLVPLAMVDPEHSPLYGWSGYVVRWVPIVSLAGALVFAVQMAWHVQVVRRRTDFRFVDSHDEPRLCRIVEPLTIAAGLPTPYVAVIDNGALNAFACGIRRKDAVLVFTRGLIDGLDDDELAAVVAHEISHVVNGDIRLIASANVWLDTLRLLQPRVRKNNKIREALAFPVLAIVLPMLIVVIVAVCFIRKSAVDASRLMRLLIASSREFIADAEAVRLTHSPAALVSALRRIAGHSTIPGLGAGQDAMMIDGAHEGAMATHPTIRRRIEAIVAVTGSMSFIAPSRRDTRADPLPAGAGRAPNAGTVGGGAINPAVMALRQRSIASVPVRDVPGDDLNRLGLTREMTIGLAAAVAICAVTQSGALGRLPVAAAFDHSGLKSLFSMAGNGLRCQLGGMASLVGISGRPTDCGDRTISEALATQRGKGGLLGAMADAAAAPPNGVYTWPDGSFRTAMPPAMRLAQVRTQRCFQTGPYAVGDRGLHSVSERSSDRNDISLTRYLGYAEAAATDLMAAPAGKRAAAVKEYLRTRKLMVEVIHRFFGEPGLAIARSTFGRPPHTAAVARVREQLADSTFVSRLDDTAAAEMRLLAESPDDFVSCVARRTRRS